MVITHVNGLFYAGGSPVLDFFTWWGATVCFTIFLFVSGSVTGIGIELNKVSRAGMIRRIIRILLIYYGTAFILKVIKFGFVESFAGIFDLLVFRDIPEFTEFIVPLIVYPVIPLLIPRKMLKWLTKPLVILPVGFLLFYIANYLYPLSWGDGYINVIKGILVGHGDLHRFGVLSYFPVFAMGLAWGGRVVSFRMGSIRNAAIACAVSSVVFFMLKFSGISGWERWPPSLCFLLYGIPYSFLVLWTFRVISKFRMFESAVTFAGVNAFKYYVYHIILLYIFGWLVSWKTFSGFQVLFVLLFSSILSTGLVLIRNKTLILGIL